ncbi:MAG: DUF3368 domain-containing protein [Lachnospiraceae bacterium]|nr:DUF3368 domain-containing protein [Lachnospiraceae bacterium]MBQ2981604.1 DUF3368 domain-containing protein [Lachnospiraceae bacterium]
MLIISDTTPIISLIKADKLYLLEKMFENVIIPKAVYDELTVNEKYGKEIAELKEAIFIKVGKVENNASVNILRNVTGLDAGESEAIVMAEENDADLLLMDEHKGRQVAKKLGIRITGTIGILLQAFDEGMLSREDIVNSIVVLKESNIRISDNLCKKVYEHIKI